MLDTQGAAGILPNSSDERKRGEAFPQSRLVGQTKQSHLTWRIGSQTRSPAGLILEIDIVFSLANLRCDQLKKSKAAVSRLYMAPAILMVPLLSRPASTALFLRTFSIVIWTFVRATASTKA